MNKVKFNFLWLFAFLILFHNLAWADKLTNNFTAPLRNERSLVPGMGVVNVVVGQSPAAALPIPILAVNSDMANQQRQVNWGSTWRFADIPPGKYLVTGVPIEKNGVTYTVAAKTIDVPPDGTINVNMNYTGDADTTGPVTVNLVNPPSAQVPVTFTGAKQTINQTVQNGAVLTLPADTYNISSNVPNYTASASPNPITVPTQNSVTITYTPVAASGKVTITLVNAPSASVPVTLTGKKSTISQNVSNGTVLTLPEDTYDVTSNVPGYTVTPCPNPIVVPTQTNLVLSYQPATSIGKVTVTLNNAPSATVPITFKGNLQTINQTVGNGAVISLPADTYTVSSNVPNYTATAIPNPIKVPEQTTLSVTYTPVPIDTSNRTINFTNQCPFPVWFGFISGVTNARGKDTPVCGSDADCFEGSICVDRGGGVKHCFWKNPEPTNSNFQLAPRGGTNSVKIPIFNNSVGAIWSGAVAGRTNCTATGCETADCGGGVGPCKPGRGFAQPATQAEFTFSKKSPDFYDIEFINGMNLPVEMNVINPPATNDPYNCGSPGSPIARSGMGGCTWMMSPPSNDYVWVKAGGATCTSDATCTAPNKCGLSFNPGQNPLLKKTCGKVLGYWTANQVCGIQPSYGAPFNCQQRLQGSQSDLILSDLYGCNKLGSCYSDGATPRCCGCTNWDKIGIPVPPGPMTKQCIATNPDWKPNVEPKLAWLKRACPSSYTYPFDDMSSTFVCTMMQNQVNSVNYNIVFCPGGATGGTQHFTS